MTEDPALEQVVHNYALFFFIEPFYKNVKAEIGQNFPNMLRTIVYFFLPALSPTFAPKKRSPPVEI